MALEKRTDVFYELLIRGNYGAEHQVGELGGFSGAHLIVGEAIVDDGRVISFKPGDPQPLDREQIAPYLDDRFAEFEVSYRQQAEALANVRAELDATRTALQEAQAERDVLRAENGRVVSELAGIKSALASIAHR